MSEQHRHPPGGARTEGGEAGMPAKTPPAHAPSRVEHDDCTRRRYCYPMPVSEWACYLGDGGKRPVPRVYLSRYDIARRYSCGLTKAQACINALPHVRYNGRMCVKLSDLLRYEDRGYSADWKGYRDRKATKKRAAAARKKKGHQA